MRKNGLQEQYDRWRRKRKWERPVRMRPERHLNWPFIISALAVVTLIIALLVTKCSV